MAVIKNLCSKYTDFKQLYTNRYSLIDSDMDLIFCPKTGSVGIIVRGGGPHYLVFAGSDMPTFRMWYVDGGYYPVFDEHTDDYLGSFISGHFMSKAQILAGSDRGHSFDWSTCIPIGDYTPWLP